MDSNWEPVCNTTPSFQQKSITTTYLDTFHILTLSLAFLYSLENILSKSVRSLFLFLSFLSSCRRSVAWMQVSLRRHSCVDGSCFRLLKAFTNEDSWKLYFSFFPPHLFLVSFSFFYKVCRTVTHECGFTVRVVNRQNVGVHQHHGQLQGVPVIQELSTKFGFFTRITCLFIAD